MGDRARLAKARMELEELYLGVPDDSVNLTFQDFADMQQKTTDPSENNKKKSTTMDTVHEGKASSLTKLPSLDFNRGLQETSHHHQQRRHLHHKPYPEESGDDFGSHMEMDHHHHRPRHHDSHAWKDHQQRHATSPGAHTDQFRHGMERSLAYDDVSVVSMASNYPERGQRRRPGIPHSNICTICSTYIYIFRHRCLVCGRVYCRQCVCVGMGEMTEGRKCVMCLGRRFSPRKDGLLLEVPEYSEASRAEVGGERATKKRGANRWAEFSEHDIEGKKPSKESNKCQNGDDDDDHE
ncbi:putative Cytochrome p450 79a2 [Hibiscus syriacus]|uniref:Cytochrome p450 79a2 n=1 Tax=Hibiscus syriacus TaxID=106335 RepID=A0A6A3BAU8_HIBSY|nr:putative Cytochrome p450 79a2 [Hibiscus syriacus]